MIKAGSIVATLALCGLCATSQAALYDRGNGMIYDSIQDITWLQDWNYTGTSGFSTQTTDWNSAPGAVDWYQAKAWADSLVYGGFSDWRLPSAKLENPDSPCVSYQTSACDFGANNTRSEIGHLIIVDLNNAPYYWNGQSSIPNLGVNSIFWDSASNTYKSFMNMAYDNGNGEMFWEMEEYGPDTSAAAIFDINMRSQAYDSKSNDIRRAAAVRDGDVAAVPVPATAWLFGSGLIGLLSAYRRRK